MTAINVRLGDSYTIVDPFVPDELERALSYWHKEFARDEATMQTTVRGETRKLFSIKNTLHPKTGYSITTMITLPGFAFKVRQLLTELGYLVHVTDERTPAPNFDMPAACEKLRDYQLECAHVALHSRGGVISCVTGWGKTHIMGALIRGFPKEEMVMRGTPKYIVVTPTLDISGKNYKDLQEIFPDRDIGLVNSDFKKLSDDIQVVTPESMHHIGVSDAGLLIYDEVHTLTMPRVAPIMDATKALRYGMSATPTGRFDGGDLLIEGIFGPIVYSRTYPQAIDDGAVVPIRVYWVEAPQPARWPENGYRTKNAGYRHGIWRNNATHNMCGEILHKVPHDSQCLTVVDKLEHMQYLKPHMRDVTIVHAETSQKRLDSKKFNNLHPVSKKERAAIYKKVENNEIKRILSTGVYRVGVNFPDLRVLINAEGMGSQILAGQLPGRASRNIDGKNIAYIVDFFHPWDMVSKNGRQKPGMLLRDDRSRESVYTSLGFEQMWVNDLNQISFFD